VPFSQHSQKKLTSHEWEAEKTPIASKLSVPDSYLTDD